MDRPGHDERYSLDSRKIVSKIKWKHKTRIDYGLYKTMTWYTKNLNFFKRISKKNITKRLGLNI